MIQLAPDASEFASKAAYEVLPSRIRRLSYLRCPSKIQAAIKNETGKTASIKEIERVLKSLARSEYDDVGEPQESDGLDYAPRALSHGALMRRSASKRRDEQENQERVEMWRRYWAGYEPPENDNDERVPTLPVRALIAKVCWHLGFDPDDLADYKRDRRHTAARSVIAKLLRERNAEGWSYYRLAGFLGRGDHSTIMFSVKNFPTYCKRHPGLFDLYKELGGRDNG